MAFYSFTREDFEAAVHSHQFTAGVRHGLNLAFFPSAMLFQGTPEELTLFTHDRQVDTTKYSLPYISPCEHPNNYEGETRDLVVRDVDTRQQVMNKAHDIYDPEWWCYLHMCHVQALFILFPLMRLLYPKTTWYLCDSKNHVFLLNRALEEFDLDKIGSTSRDVHAPLIVDLISFCLNDLTNWGFQGPHVQCFKLTVDSPSIVPWIMDYFSYAGFEVSEVHAWYQSLF